MGVEPPFVYDRPSTYSFNGPTDRGFNPKAITHASRAPRAPRPKRDGPLIEFNRHPDSYLIVPYGNLNVKPMSPNTCKKVQRARWAQLALRSLELLAALGMLFCVIAIHKTSSAVGWIIRLAPAVALLHTFYGVYHFCRPATGRTAGSTASYMIFAAMIDTGLIPFFVFCAMMSHQDYSTNAYGWSTLFNTSQITYKIIYAFFLTSLVAGVLLIISLVLGVYLALIFRKIAKLPPDMNPLEPNLTARPHKRNKSELTLVEKQATKSTDNLITGTRRVPFIHTRTDSADSVTLHSSSPRQSRADLGLAKDDPYRRSNLSVADSTMLCPEPALSPPSAPFANTGLEGNYKRNKSPDRASKASSKASSWLSYLDFEGVPTPLSEEAEKTLDDAVHPPDPISSVPSRASTPVSPTKDNRNWFTTSARNSQVSLAEYAPAPQSNRASMYDTNEDLSVPPLDAKPKKRSREPLAMNPPTPIRDQYQDENILFHGSHDEDQQSAYQEPQRHALRDTDSNRAPKSKQISRPSSFVGSGGKSRFYGELRSSIGSLSKSDHKKADDASDSVSNYSRTRTMESNDSHFQIHSLSDDEDGGSESNYITQYQPSNWNGPRQISNSTGYDLNSGYAGLGAEFGRGMGRRREVSGKVAEEGRGLGYGGFGAPETEGVVATGQEKMGGAAGWARFKGL